MRINLKIHDGDIYIIDYTKPEYVNYRIYNSYEFWDDQLISDTVYWLKRYNDKEGRTQFDRSLRSLQSEWVEHTILYYVLYWNDYYRECARSADLDENRNGAYHCIFYDFY